LHFETPFVYLFMIQQKIESITIGSEKWYKGIDIFKAIGITWRGGSDLRTRSIDKDSFKILKHKTKGGIQDCVFIKKSGVANILRSSISISKESLDMLNSECELEFDYIVPRQESEILDIIDSIFIGNNIDIPKRQHKVGKYRLDAYSKRFNFIIEIDDSYHNKSGQSLRDSKRMVDILRIIKKEKEGEKLFYPDIIRVPTSARNTEIVEGLLKIINGYEFSYFNHQWFTRIGFQKKELSEEQLSKLILQIKD